MDELLREDFKEPQRPSAWVAVLAALALLAGAYFTWYTGVEYFAEGVNDFFVNFEKEYDGIENG